MMQSRVTNKYPPARWAAIKRFLVAALREGWEASSIATTLAAASVRKTTPAAIVEIFNIGFLCAADLVCPRQAMNADPIHDHNHGNLLTSTLGVVTRISC